MADSNTTLAATRRTEFGKGAARRIRREDQIPAVLYGHGTDPVHLTLPGHSTWLALKDNPNALLTITFDGGQELALARDVQRDPVRRTIDHIDFILVRKGEKVVVDVSVILDGESAPGTIHMLESQTLSVLADATKIPESLEVSIEGLEEGAIIRAGEVSLPDGVELETDPEYEVVIISVPRAEVEEDEEEDEEAEAGAAEEAESEAPTDES
ncbi:MAG TPA: 50S ribosomal protein L25/general stress protein Ctc [Candidatus Ruania gallistercoris]|uniref:Large ribosomal subunit protein bL25 n=1 Tax=Candidatus Ruania gallistercoris TaxID=2838746 RepID=A0A9D2EEN2_9MICO|nr:50S ribosomal protein L25/general stress protein Ctc [Candidatus Ruania gallistercoris]